MTRLFPTILIFIDLFAAGGYIFAHEAGMDVEGLGAKTKAYFWPNAFLREFAGLLVAQWRMILQVYLVIAVIYAAAAIVYISG